MKKLKHLSQTQTAPVVVDDASAGNDVDRGHDHEHHSHPTDEPGSGKHHHVSKKMHRKQMRERKWAEKRKTLVAYATANTDSVESDKVPSCVDVVAVAVEVAKPTSTVETDNLVHGLEGLHVSVELDAKAKTDGASAVQLLAENDDEEGDDGDDDVFASPTLATPHATFTGGSTVTTATYLSVDMEKGAQGEAGEGGMGGGKGKSRLIVEALVVRKMSLDEAFLDFGGFALM
jgi:hypothetical protein